MYRAGLESVLGLKRRGHALSLDPCIPSAWPGFSIVIRIGETRYDITVENPKRRCRGLATVVLDGVPVDAAEIPWRDDGRVHTVRAVIGDPMAGTNLAGNLGALPEHLRRAENT